MTGRHQVVLVFRDGTRRPLGSKREREGAIRVADTMARMTGASFGVVDPEGEIIHTTTEETPVPPDTPPMPFPILGSDPMRPGLSLVVWTEFEKVEAFNDAPDPYADDDARKADFLDSFTVHGETYTYPPTDAP